MSQGEWMMDEWMWRSHNHRGGSSDVQAADAKNQSCGEVREAVRYHDDDRMRRFEGLCVRRKETKKGERRLVPISEHSNETQTSRAQNWNLWEKTKQSK